MNAPALRPIPGARDGRFADFDPTVINRTRQAAPPLPLPLFGGWSKWIEETAENAGAPPEYVALPLLVSVAALVGNTRQVVPYRGSDWREPFVLWGGLVGDPSSNKSPATDPIVSALRFVEHAENADFEARERDHQTRTAAAEEAEKKWREEVKQAVKAGDTVPPKPDAARLPEKPVRRRILVGDATPETVVLRSLENPRGILSNRDELAGWIAAFDRYQSGDSKSVWLEGFGARSFSVDRITDGRSGLVPRLSLSVLGTIQPDRLNSLLLKGDDDGLPARFMWAWPDPLPPRRPGPSAPREFIQQAFQRLRSLSFKKEDGQDVPMDLLFSSEAADLFDRWQSENYRQMQARTGRLQSAWGKMKGHVVRLAGVLQLASWAIDAGPEPSSIDVAHFQAAAGLVEAYMKPMAARVYADASTPRAERHAAALARWIVAEDPAVVNARSVWHDEAGRTGINNAADAEAACSALVERGWLAAVERPGAPGRPRKDYIVNPAVETLRA